MSKFLERSKILKKVHLRTDVPPLANSVDELSDWFTSPMGRAVLSAQKKILAQELHNLFGYHLMQLSVVPGARLHAASRINHCFNFSPKEGLNRKKIAGVSDFQNLPLPDESIDVCVLHHALDFSQDPQQVLKEAARVTIPKGYIVLLGFNPWSLRGLVKHAAQFVSKKAIWHHHSLRVGRIKDWLGFLDFSSASARYSFFNFPINSKKYIRNTHYSGKWSRSQLIPMGAVYCIVARKDNVAMTPIRPNWNVKSSIVPAAVSRRAVSSHTNAGSAIVLPLRKRKIINKP